MKRNLLYLKHLETRVKDTKKPTALVGSRIEQGPWNGYDLIHSVIPDSDANEYPTGKVIIPVLSSMGMTPEFLRRISRDFPQVDLYAVREDRLRIFDPETPLKIIQLIKKEQGLGIKRVSPSSIDETLLISTGKLARIIDNDRKTLSHYIAGA